MNTVQQTPPTLQALYYGANIHSMTNVTEVTNVTKVTNVTIAINNADNALASSNNCIIHGGVNVMASYLFPENTIHTLTGRKRCWTEL